ncbi:tetratricopeptide repeat protein [Actinoplanes bogorensis]|uniref:Tetratricopeptide repeat protein n=1 Tax=Paractinoplanes bogorensis TaxID=1610840 RepID=A0ABS5YKB3_9ACTN|nr:tetratricopeptide repeat protein [Actinoplanes bogorensis]MBU2663872.1 tetratricopeptide repeat protein [Actinoplanes bogorensis]
MRRYTHGRIALSNLDASIRTARTGLADLLFLRADVRGRIADTRRALALLDDTGDFAPMARARAAGRLHRFDSAHRFLDRAPTGDIGVTDERAALWQAQGRFDDALRLRQEAVAERPGLPTWGGLAVLLVELGRPGEARDAMRSALAADRGTSPFAAAQLLFGWAAAALGEGDLETAAAGFRAVLELIPGHVPAQGHLAEVHLERGATVKARILLTPLLDISDDPEYPATLATVLEREQADRTVVEPLVERARSGYERLLADWPEAYADHAAHFYLTAGRDPERARELAALNLANRDTPRARRLMHRAGLS